MVRFPIVVNLDVNMITEELRMATRNTSFSPVSDQIKAILRKQIDSGWTPARIAVEMNRLGHKSWTVPVVTGATKDRFMTVDEAISLLALFRGNAQLITREIDKVADAIVKATGKEERA